MEHREGGGAGSGGVVLPKNPFELVEHKLSSKLSLLAMAILASVLALPWSTCWFRMRSNRRQRDDKETQQSGLFQRQISQDHRRSRRAAGAGSEANLVHTDDNDAAPLNVWTDAAPQLHPLEVDRHHFSLTF